MSQKDDVQRHIPQRGYAAVSSKTRVLTPGWCHDHQEPHTNDGTALPNYFKDLTEEKLALFGENDEYIAIAAAKAVVVFSVKDIGNADKTNIPIAEVATKNPVSHVIATGSRNSMGIITADSSGALWSYNFSPAGSRRTIGAINAKPGAKLLAEGIKEKIINIVGTQKHIVVQTQRPSGQGYRLYELDRRTHTLYNRGDVNLDTPVSALHTGKDDALVGYEKGELRLLTRDQSGVTVQALDAPRVSAATIVNNRHMIVAQKGGYIAKVDIAKATTASVGVHTDAIARACKRLCEILRRCGCLEPCGCKDPNDVPRPEDDPDRPNGGHSDDEPCDERQSAQLQWTPKRLAAVGQHIVALSANANRMAVLDHKLNVVFERYLGRSGAAVQLGQAKTQRLLIFQPQHQRLESWSLADYVATLPGRLPDDFTFIPPAPPSTVTYYGARKRRADPNPHLNVCVFTVIEPGQAYTDPNQDKLFAQMEPNVFDIVNDYYDENSYGDLDVRFSVFGHDFGGARTPLVLPQPIADYFWDDFTPGGVRAIMPADWADPVVLDGTEELELHTNPRTGASKNYNIPFAALWTQETHNSYPVTVDFDGTETLQLTIEDQEGNTHVLNLAFAAQTFTHNQGDDETAFLTALGSYITDTIRDAEAALAGDPVTIQDVVFRRVRLNDDDDEFGRLQGQFKVAAAAPADVVQKGTIEVTAAPAPLPDALDAIGFASSGREFGVLTSNNAMRDYLNACLSAAQTDQGEGPGSSDPHFNSSVSSSEDVGAQELTVTITLTNNKGGAGADIEVASHSGHNASGWSAATPLPGSESNANNQNALRHSRQLADDVFTAAMEHIRAQGPWNAAATSAMFEDFDVMMIGFVGAPPGSVPPADQWGADNPNDFGRLRMFRRTHIASDQNNPNPGDPPVSMNTSVVIGQKFSSFSAGVMAHELGHALGLPDLYSASGYRDDVLYIDSWAMMGGGNSNFNHFCGWSKWKLGWIAEDADPNVNRVVDVPLPAPVGTTTTEAWLVPVEYWDNSMKADVEAVVGGGTPIAQLMKIHLGSDGGIINFLELHAPGASYSQNLPPSPSVIATNVLDPESDRRWAVNGLYRRSVHRLNQGNELMNPGDTWDFASGIEFPLKGCTVEVVDVQSIRGGSIPIFHLRVEREEAEFIDLHFQDHVPSWRSPDIWVDWPGDNPDPNVPRIYPEGTPTDQGETVRFPDAGVEKHFLVARVHNAGSVRAEDVKVRWFICDPPGSGDDGRWVERDTKTIPEVAGGSSEIAAFDWNVDSSTNVHQCIRAEIIDWTIPAEVDPMTGDTVHLASDDVKLQNNNAQQNVFDFEALAGSPFDAINFTVQVHNDSVDPEIAALVPDGLPWGSKIEISPAEAVIQSGHNKIFQCKLSLNDAIIQPGCDNDSGFLLTSWRRAEDSDEKWGSCFYHIRPRYKTKLGIDHAYWLHDRLTVSGQWILDTTDAVDISGEKPLFVRLRLEFQQDGGGGSVIWRTLPLDNNGHFSFDLQDEPANGPGVAVAAQAWFDRTDLLGSSVSKLRVFKRQFIG